MTANAKKAVKIGSLCFLAYLAVYIAKNILGTVTPAMEASGFVESAALTAKSVYFYAYAVGQLINGAVGDKIKAKYMMSFGLALAGISNFAFSLINARYLEGGGENVVGLTALRLLLCLKAIVNNKILLLENCKCNENCHCHNNKSNTTCCKRNVPRRSPNCRKNTCSGRTEVGSYRITKRASCSVRHLGVF